MRKAIALNMIGFACGAVVVGLMFAGGPEHARQMQRDFQRYSDLGALKSDLRCHNGDAPDALPDEAVEYCGALFEAGEAREDPMTNADYRYLKLDALRYQICADFETEKPPWRYSDTLKSFDHKTGCLTASVRR